MKRKSWVRWEDIAGAICYGLALGIAIIMVIREIYP